MGNIQGYDRIPETSQNSACTIVKNSIKLIFYFLHSIFVLLSSPLLNRHIPYVFII
ncbi:Uncharacterised protein [Salmonella enterica]|nr:Uncharacterised protein [Salmonella enterica]